MKSQIITLISLFVSSIALLELYFNGRLARLLFGDSVEQDFDDIPLPSERREQEKAPSRTAAPPRKRRFPLPKQLSLLFKKTLFRVIYRIVLLLEHGLGPIQRKAVSQKVSQNHYL